MNLKMIQPKMKQKIYYFQLLKIVKRSLNKLIGKQKKHCNLNLPKQGKNFPSNHQSQLMDL